MRAGVNAGALRDATVATVTLAAAVAAGSGMGAHLDPALAGYLAATLVAAFLTVRRVSAFWRRAPSAFYGRALLAALGRPGTWATLARRAARDLGAQRCIAPRGALRWAAHLALSWGTLGSFAITLPLVWGWVHFEAAGEARYQLYVLTLPLARFAPDGALGWLGFHALAIAAVAVVAGALYFLAVRMRARHETGAVAGFHVAPLLLLLAVAVTGLALPVVGARGTPRLIAIASVAHQVTVVALLVALPASKLLHLFIRPLQLGVALVRAETPVACAGCGAALASAAQLGGVESLLAAHGFHFADHSRFCTACRRCGLAATQAVLLGARFQPRPAAWTRREVLDNTRTEAA